MDRNTAIFASVIGAGLALRFGPAYGQSAWGVYDQSAPYRGMAWVGGGGTLGAYFLLRRIRYDLAVAAIFAVIMAWLYGRQVGYSLYFARNDLQADIYGCGTVFIGALIPGELVVWPVARNLGNAVITAMDRGFANFDLLQRIGIFGALRPRGVAVRESPEEIWASIERGETLTYASQVNRDFSYFDGRTRKIRLRMAFNLKRDTLAMQPRERAAWFILRMLRRHPLNADLSDRWQFALTWGGGACSMGWDKFESDPRVLQGLGLRTGEDVIRHEAAARGAGVEAAISELFGFLRAEASRPDAPEELRKLQADFFNPAPQPGGNSSQWS